MLFVVSMTGRAGGSDAAADARRAVPDVRPRRGGLLLGEHGGGHDPVLQLHRLRAPMAGLRMTDVFRAVGHSQLEVQQPRRALVRTDAWQKCGRCAEDIPLV